MWTVVYIAPTVAMADRLKGILESEGMLVNLKRVDVDEGGRGSNEIQVPEGEAEEAHEIITENLGRLR